MRFYAGTAAVLVAMLAMAVPSIASADWYLSQRAAESYVKTAAHERYQVNRYKTSGYCWPKGQADAFLRGRTSWAPAHSWQCAWVRPHDDGSTCSGGIAIKGTTSTRHDFIYVVIVGQRCE
jgi:hypothetical protein